MSWRWIVVATILLDLCRCSFSKDCLMPNYITRASKIYAVNPMDTSEEIEVKLKGVNWAGMEGDKAVLMGLWGEESNSTVSGTTIKKMASFLAKNKFNSIRIPLNIEGILNKRVPDMNLVHRYNNPEVGKTKTYLEFLQGVIVSLQSSHLTVLLDLHSLNEEKNSGLWYSGPYKPLEKTPIFQALNVLIDAVCSNRYWNVIGIDLKNEPFSGRWDAKSDKSKQEKNWKIAAETLANVVMTRCPHWLSFVEGVGSEVYPDDYHVVSPQYPMEFGDWHGGNLRNALINPLKVSKPNKIVFSPHAYSHGVYPQSYFYSLNSKCETYPEVKGQSMCVDYYRGAPLSKPYHHCADSIFGCTEVGHLDISDLEANLNATLEQMFGFLVRKSSTPLVLGEFGGVYGSHQPQQSAVLDFLVHYVKENLSGGYYWALNPESEFYLESPVSLNEEETILIFGKTHFGLMEVNSWESENEELLNLLNQLPTSENPCFGELYVTTHDLQKVPGISQGSTILSSRFPILVGFIFGTILACGYT